MDYIVFLKNGDSTILRGITRLEPKGDVLYFYDYEVSGVASHTCGAFNLNNIAGYRVYNGVKWGEYFKENKDCDGKAYMNAKDVTIPKQ